MNIVTIQPIPHDGNSPLMTNGTRVLLADGTLLEGVKRIEIVAETNSVWTATIECCIAPPRLEGVLAQIETNAFQTDTEVEVTDISDSASRRFARFEA